LEGLLKFSYLVFAYVLHQHQGVHIEFYFITRCYTRVIENMMNDIKGKKKPAPDVIVMNSLLWDISR
jgi:hypothetical protein